MFNRHSLPALAICATVAAAGLAPSVASAHGIGGQGIGGVGRTASNVHAMRNPSLPDGRLNPAFLNAWHPGFLNPQPLPPSPVASARTNP
jgi:hypothetical protein